LGYGFGVLVNGFDTLIMSGDPPGESWESLLLQDAHPSPHSHLPWQWLISILGVDVRLAWE
jgi:hypothetical protein